MDYLDHGNILLRHTLCLTMSRYSLAWASGLHFLPFVHFTWSYASFILVIERTDLYTHERSGLVHIMIC